MTGKQRLGFQDLKCCQADVAIAGSGPDYEGEKEIDLAGVTDGELVAWTELRLAAL